MADEKQSLEAPPKDAPGAKDAPPPKEAPKEKTEKKEDGFDPGPDHPRFKEVYYKMKKYERELEERGKDLDAVRAHQQQVDAALQEMKRGSAKDDPEPDPVADPEGYRAWHRHQIQKVKKEESEQRQKDRIATLIEIEAGLHEDYPQAVAIAEREMARDPALRAKIWGETNPARAAYQHGRKKLQEDAKREKDEVERQERLDQGKVEGDTPPAPAPKEDAITDEEKRVIRNLFRDMPFEEAVKKYRGQKKELGLSAGRR